MKESRLPQRMLEPRLRKKIWIDLDNSPHVPFFQPIIGELERRGFSVEITARRCFQVCELADMHGLTYRQVGWHFGKHKLLKALGLSFRCLQLLPTSLFRRPSLSVSHGSRSQTMASTLLGIPSLVILDYEYAEFLPFFKPTWVMAPDVIPDTSINKEKNTIFRYPGIKEDVYASTFKPDPASLEGLPLSPDGIVVTARPPANEAHYYNPESDRLFRAAIDRVLEVPNTQIVMLPRNARQASAVRKMYSNPRIIFPERAVDGLNLIWRSDFVISGGGTMNREAAALGVPVYSVFRGTIGAVDHYLARQGRLVLLESVEDVASRLKVARRSQPEHREIANSEALSAIVDHIARLVRKPAIEAEKRMIHRAGS